MPAEPEPAEAKPAATAPRRAPLNAAGEERPAFLLDFPEDPELERLVAAFEAGNFALIRKQAPQLAARSTNDAVRRAALELRRRIDPDPMLLLLLGLCGVLFVFLVAWVYTR